MAKKPARKKGYTVAKHYSKQYKSKIFGGAAPSKKTSANKRHSWDPW